MSHKDYKHIGEPEDRVVEELGELLQALCKARRFGWFSSHPDTPQRTNIDDVKAEMNDVVEALESLEVKMRELALAHYPKPAGSK